MEVVVFFYINPKNLDSYVICGDYDVLRIAPGLIMEPSRDQISDLLQWIPSKSLTNNETKFVFRYLTDNIDSSTMSLINTRISLGQKLLLYSKLDKTAMVKLWGDSEGVREKLDRNGFGFGKNFEEKLLGDELLPSEFCLCGDVRLGAIKKVPIPELLNNPNTHPFVADALREIIREDTEMYIAHIVNTTKKVAIAFVVTSILAILVAPLFVTL